MKKANWLSIFTKEELEVFNSLSEKDKKKWELSFKPLPEEVLQRIVKQLMMLA